MKIKTFLSFSIIFLMCHSVVPAEVVETEERSIDSSEEQKPDWIERYSMGLLMNTSSAKALKKGYTCIALSMVPYDYDQYSDSSRDYHHFRSSDHRRVGSAA